MTPQSRAAELWKHFAGMFGADALKRKFGAIPPEEWVACLSRLQPHELERGMRRLLHSGRDQVPTLPAFLRLCRAVGDDSIDDEAPPLPMLTGRNTPEADPWEVAANRHLLKHITDRIYAAGRPYGRPASAHAMRVMTTPNADASPEFIRNVHRLVDAKKAWAADMRDLAQNGPVPITVQRQCWADYIGRAESDIAIWMREAIREQQP